MLTDVGAVVQFNQISAPKYVCLASSHGKRVSMC